MNIFTYLNIRVLFIFFVGLYLLVFFKLPDIFFLAPFRESQTAISAYYLVDNIPNILKYETPVMGNPWMIPFEFPFYQFFVSIFAEQDPQNIRDIGRLMSLLFFFGSVFIWKDILDILGLAKDTKKAFLLILLASPIYFSYSFAVMIESSAIFLASLYLKYALKFFENHSFLFLFISAIFGLIASITKATTWFPFGTFLTCNILSLFIIGKIDLRQTLVFLIIFLVPNIAVAFSWTGFTDSLKELSPIGEAVSSENLRNWNYGTLDQKTNIFLILFIILKSMIFSIGAIFIMTFFLPIKGFFSALALEKKLLIGSFLIAFIAPILIFTNLYLRHDYYTYANGIFFIALFSILLGNYFFENKNLKFLSGIALAITLSISFSYFYLKSIYTTPSNNEAIFVINEKVDPGNIIILGESYNSVIPFETQRRALMIHNKDLVDDINRIVELNENDQWSALIITDDFYKELSHELIKGLNKNLRFKNEFYKGSFIYTENELNYVSKSQVPDFYDIFDLENSRLERGSIYFRFKLENGPLFSIGYCRNETLFHLELFKTNFYRYNNVCS